MHHGVAWRDWGGGSRENTIKLVKYRLVIHAYSHGRSDIALKSYNIAKEKL